MNGNNPESPIIPLWSAFAGAPFSLAPERAEELKDLIAARNIHFTLDDETHQMRFEGADLFGGLGLVCVGLRGLERLWVHAYASTHFYLRYQAVGFAQPINLLATTEGQAVAELLNWALQGEMQGNPAPWPDNLPKPIQNPADAQNQIANELFWGAAGFAVLHEIGHIVRDHKGVNLPRDVKYRHEFEADEWAYDWVMNKWRDFQAHDTVFKKRTTLIATLFSLIAVNQVYRPRRVVESNHPNTIDRLLRFLTKHANEDSGLPIALAWGVAGATIHFHLSQRLDNPLPVFDRWRTYFNAIHDAVDCYD